MDAKLRALRLKKAQLFEQMEMLSSVSDTMYSSFGKVESEIMFLEKQILRETKNDLDEN